MAANSRYQLQAFGFAVIAEIILLAGAAFALASSESTKLPRSAAVSISMVNEDKPLPKPPAPKRPQVLPKEPQSELPKVAEAQVNTFTEPTPPPPEPEAAKAEPSAEYAAKVHAAVQAAHYYPPAAAALRYTGRVRLEFHLRDVAPSEIRLVVASGIGVIDRAALQAVQNAKYPEPPPEIKGSDHIYQVWVEFTRN